LCDEFGDQALKSSASDFFIIGAIVVAAHREPQLPQWTTRINRRRPHWKDQPLHFTNLDERMKLWATRFIGKLPLRCFAIISHKANMIGYRNVRAERASDLRIYGDDGTSFTIEQRRKLWYSHIVLKVLLERATQWCHARTLRDYRELRPVEITIAQRGGFYLDRFKTYLDEKDRRNWLTKTGILPGYLAWPVVNMDLIRTAPADNTAGLQLADVVAGSFSRAIDQHRFGTCDRRFVENLAWRLARKGRERRIAKWGTTGLPWELWKANLTNEQEQLFRMFGYTDEKLVRPGLILPGDM
jgi:hypothetical protein